MRESFFDGCHRYGWLITLIGQAALFAYFVGGMRSDVSSMAERLTRVERAMDVSSANAAAAALAAQRAASDATLAAANAAALAAAAARTKQ